jgi:DNA-binding NarL/FixJ family response regulator
MDPVRVLIVDDEADMRLLVRSVLRNASGLEVVGEAGSGEEAFDAVRTLDPDVVVLDYRMPDLTGVDVAERLLSESPDRAIVLLSAFLTDATVTAAERVGVRSCLLKDRMFDLPGELRRIAS